jgi:hypothetical protein
MALWLKEFAGLKSMTRLKEERNHEQRIQLSREIMDKIKWMHLHQMGKYQYSGNNLK